MSSDGADGGLQFDPLSLFLNASPPMLVLSVLLLLSSALAWFIIVLKLRQLRRWTRAEEAFERELSAGPYRDTRQLSEAEDEQALGARLLTQVLALGTGQEGATAALEHAVALEQRRVLSLMTALASVGSAAPLAGLFGTVYGIIEAFSRIGRDKTVVLHAVAPAIGDALITTALGLMAAIPAVIAFNLLTRRLEDFLDESSSFVRAWLGNGGLGTRHRP